MGIKHNDKLDHKFYGEIFRTKDDKLVPDSIWMVFLAHDNAVPATLRFYAQKCAELGADERHLRALEQLIDRVIKWRERHPHWCKVPDVEVDERLEPR
jgi:hypothetical protein